LEDDTVMEPTGSFDGDALSSDGEQRTKDLKGYNTMSNDSRRRTRRVGVGAKIAAGVLLLGLLVGAALIIADRRSAPGAPDTGVAACKQILALSNDPTYVGWTKSANDRYRREFAQSKFEDLSKAGTTYMDDDTKVHLGLASGSPTLISDQVAEGAAQAAFTQACGRHGVSFGNLA
jgi:hypothetical protein